MDYGRLGAPEPGSSQTESLPNQATSALATNQRHKLKLFFVISGILIVIGSVFSAILLVGLRNRPSGKQEPTFPIKPTQAISDTCRTTRYPTLCVNSLLEFPSSLSANEQELVHVSVNLTLQRFGNALNVVSDIDNIHMDPTVRMAYEDCLELMEDSVDLLTRSLNSAWPSSNGDQKGRRVVSTHDVVTWLSAALTNQDTCRDGFENLRGPVKDQMEERLRNLSELVSNCLAIYRASNEGGRDLAGDPNRRRLMTEFHDRSEESEFPGWVSQRDRVLLESPISALQADIVVSKDGNGTYETITEAIKKVPEYSERRVIIYVKAGRYEEDNLKVGRKKTNVMMIGDGKGKTVISGGKSIFNNMTTFHTASFGKISPQYYLDYQGCIYFM